jgi:predicted RecA/RadA family phage recombinase
MKNFKQLGGRMDVVASATVTSGDLVKVGSKIVVAMGNALSGETFVGATCGVFVVPKEAGAVTQGAALYFKASTKTVTTSATGNTLAGYAFSSAESGDATVDMYLVDNITADV